ncbi:MAG: primosomal protein N' [Thermotogae bacterium]|nr:primosomal protein N' [Thermotogota bacterium]
MAIYSILTEWGTFSYEGEDLGRGEVVKVPLRGGKVVGVVLGEGDWRGEVKPIIGKVGFSVPEDVLDLVEILSGYYLTPMGRFLPLILPPSLHRRAKVRYRRVLDNPPPLLRRDHLDLWEYLATWRPLSSIVRRFGEGARSILRVWVERGHVVRKEHFKVPQPGEVKLLEYEEPYDLPRKPTPHQERLLYRIGRAVGRGKYAAFLLWGETGSGKTYVYIRAAEEALGRGKSVLVLVPEILLSYHIARAFYEAFGESFAVYHSGITATQRSNVWFAARQGDVRVILAVKTGVFVPLRDLGLVIVDEEHEGSYKEEDRPPLFNARDVAVLRAFHGGAVAILGTATPSLESYHNVRRRKYILLRLRERIGEYREPEIVVVDMRGKRGVMSDEFKARLSETLEEGRNAIVFLNRRGFLPYYYCEDCGNPVKCPNCDTVLALHRNRRGEILKCHVCGHITAPPESCPVCGGPNLKGTGTGTQKVEDLLREEFGVEVARLDTDAVRRRREVIRILEEFGAGRLRILVGTKMVVKGLDFRNVGFVGVLNADSFLSRPADFRAEEKTYQTLVQVVGRIRTGGVALIQTKMPHHEVFRTILSGAGERFYASLYRRRGMVGLPPFRKMAVLEVRSRDPSQWRENESILEDFVATYDGDALLWGPYYPTLAKRKGWYRLRLTALADEHRPLHHLAREIERLPLKGQAIWDVDPYDLD